MKILSVNLKNLNSLVGEWKIDFVSSGIFAIVGPTGVGKTTILDAICLALYGQTPRLNRVNSSENEIMSRNTNECHAEVVFETHRNGKFCARWEQNKRKRKSDSLSPYKHIICKIDESGTHELNCKTAEAPALITKITGLDFERFTRSILLAQGNFAKFLNSNPTERSGILEQITQTEIYSKISEKTHERFKEEKNKYALCDAELNAIKIDDKDTIEQNNTQLKTLRENSEKLLAQQNKINKIIKNQESIKDIQNKLKEYNTELESITKKETIFKTDADKLDSARKAKNIDKYYEKFTSLKKIKNEYEEKLNKIEPLILNAKNNFTQAEKNNINTNIDLKNIEIKHNEKIKLIRIIREIDKDISLLKEQIKKFETDHKYNLSKKNELEKNISSLQEKLKNESQGKSIADLKNQIDEIDNQLTILPNKSTLNSEKEKLQTTITTIENLITALNLIDELQADLITIQAEINQINLTTNQLQQKQTKLESEKDNIENTLAIAKENLELRLTITSLAEHRNGLKTGSPCPLCGALNHPFAETESNITDLADGGNNLLKNAKKHVKDTEKLLNSKKDELNITKSEIEKYKNKLNEINKKNQTTTDTINNEKNKISNPAANIINTTAELNLLQNQLNNLQKTTNDIDKFLDMRTKLHKQIETAQLTDNKIIIAKKQLEDIVNNIDNIETELKPIKNDYEIRQNERFKLLQDDNPDEIEKLSTKELDNAKEKQANAEKELNNKKLELVQLEKEREITLENKSKNETDIKNAEQTFLEQLQTEGFNSESDFLNARLEPKKLQEIETEADRIKNERQKFTTLKENYEKKLNDEIEYAKTLAIENEPNETNFDINQLRENYNETGNKIKDVNIQIGILNEKLRSNNERQKDQEKKQAELNEIKKTYEISKKLDELIGGGNNGKKYREIVQSMTLGTLLHYANLQLAKMTDRYILLKNEESPLMIDILDAYNGGEIRTTKNLSGGESFLVSLALALGLSSMVSERIRVDSLFLDEGFGTLDEQTLEIALGVLDGLRQDGKQIGIISHVQNIQQRIRSQIRIIPKGNGRSRIDVALVEQ
ncbi:MAG: AAA family ATPase [Planctomycetaceae bacterium]|jgi:exonuclease SbcC|nr:AAA family ATPase [Planctomycetaceae bacterium]